MREKGGTVLEMINVLVIAGVIAALGYPRLTGALRQTNIRSARAAVVTLAATARGAAVARGCRTVLHVGPENRAWVTTCKLTGPGVDTLSVADLGARWGVTMSCSRDSVMFDARGLNADYQPVTVGFAVEGAADSLMINQLGKVVR